MAEQIHVNQTLRVNLNERGKNILAKSGWIGEVPENGVVEMPLWKVIKFFGQHTDLLEEPWYSGPFEIVDQSKKIDST